MLLSPLLMLALLFWLAFLVLFPLGLLGAPPRLANPLEAAGGEVPTLGRLEYTGKGAFLLGVRLRGTLGEASPWMLTLGEGVSDTEALDATLSELCRPSGEDVGGEPE